MKHAQEAQKLRDRAEECRTLAGIVKGEEARAGYLALVTEGRATVHVAGLARASQRIVRQN